MCNQEESLTSSVVATDRGVLARGGSAVRAGDRKRLGLTADKLLGRGRVGIADGRHLGLLQWSWPIQLLERFGDGIARGEEMGEEGNRESSKYGRASSA